MSVTMANGNITFTIASVYTAISTANVRCKTVAVTAGINTITYTTSLTGVILVLASVKETSSGYYYDVRSNISSETSAGFSLDSPVDGDLTYLAIKE